MAAFTRATTTATTRSTPVGNGGLPVKLRASDLSFFYGSFRALKNVTLEIRANRVTAIIGPSGCGKSTLLQTFNRMYDLVPGARTRGSVRLNERSTPRSS